MNQVAEWVNTVEQGDKVTVFVERDGEVHPFQGEIRAVPELELDVDILEIDVQAKHDLAGEKARRIYVEPDDDTQLGYKARVDVGHGVERYGSVVDAAVIE